MPTDVALIGAVRDTLAAHADPERAIGQRAYMRSAIPYRGITAPQMRTLLRAVFTAYPLPDRQTWSATVRTLWDEAGFREERYAAIALVRQRQYQRWASEPTVMPLLQHLISTGAWWDYVDDLATHCVGPVVAAHPDEAPTMRSWAVADDLWLRRTAILAQLHFGPKTDRGLLVEVIEPNLTDREFFIRKAIGWALRQYSRTDPDWIKQAVATWGDRLSPLSRREALKHLPN